MPEAAGRRVAFFGGSFDPPHVAHVLLASYVLLLGEVDEVLVVPVHSHPFGKQLAAYADRVKMCELAFAGLSSVKVSRIEEQMPAPNRTLDTLELLQREQPDARFRLVAGSDVLSEAAKWHAFDEVTRLAPLLVVSRPGYAQPGGAVLPDVSSTQIRELLARDDAAAQAELGQLVPHGVLGYVREHGLYRTR